MRAALVFAALVGCAASLALNPLRPRSVMPWMCLERCGGTPRSIAANLADILENRDVVDAVSFEIFNLGPNGTLVENNLTNVVRSLQDEDVDTWAMISSYPHPPQFLDWMRQLWGSTAGERFVDACIKAAAKYKITGFNIDFEPTGKATAHDAVMYAEFLQRMSKTLAAHGVKLSVDIASWSTVWAWGDIGQSGVGSIMIMDTYTSDFPTFKERLYKAVDSIPSSDIVIGLSSTNLTSHKPLTAGEYRERLQLCSDNGLDRVAVWDMPIPAAMWTELRAFVNHEL